MKRIIQDEEGSIIASVVLLISLSSVLLLGMTYIIKNQVIQYHNIKNAYEAKSMLEMSEFVVNERIEDESLKIGGMIRFSNGEVEVNISSDEQINMEARLTNGFTSSKHLPTTSSTQDESMDEQKEETSVDKEEEKNSDNKELSSQQLEDEISNKDLSKENNTPTEKSSEVSDEVP